MSIQRLALAAMLLVVWACEDTASIESPVKVEKPPKAPSYTRPGQRSFDQTTEGDSTGRARFCDEAEASEQVAKMVQEPIIPDKSVGGVPLWGKDGNPVVADDLLGSPDEGKFCDPSGTYSNAFAFGPLNEIIVIFDQETRQVSDIQVNSAYRGTLTGRVKHGDQTDEVYIRTRDKVRIGNRELTEYASSAQQSGRANSWLNYSNITLLYGMIRQTFFEAEPLEAGYDCVAERRCDVIYNSSDEETPQQTLVVFQDSGVTLVFSPEGQVLNVVASPVRKASFELGGVVTLGTDKVAPIFQSASVESCVIDLAAGVSWKDFRSRCIPEDGERELARANYDVHRQRDGVSVQFDGVTLDFLRKTSVEAPFEDGESPKDGDRLYSLTYTRSLPAPSVQFVASPLAADYAQRLSQYLAASLAPDAPPDHPFFALEIPVPEGLSMRPQRIGEIEAIGETGEPENWVAGIVAAVQDLYASLPEEQRAFVRPGAMKDVSLIDPFVGAVLAAFSFGKSDDPAAFTVYQTTDNERWSIGISSFIQDGVPYRMMVQYSLFFGAVTAVTVELGTSEVDDVFAAEAKAANQLGISKSPYYDMRLAGARQTWNPFRLGGNGIVIGNPDRKNDTLWVQLWPVGTDQPVELPVPGTRIEDRSGYLRPLRGERSEFVPSTQVVLSGKETAQIFHVMPDGTIGRVQQNRFKGAVGLCPGLTIAYGENVRSAIEEWHELAGDSIYQNCELVFHHTTDGHILTGVSSLANRVQFEVVAERAINAAAWR
ncbi:MAG TPA: hypothetical protein VJR89_41420 [Polyangiales bacterium]|nr:hypothetical protein [Polyangiales bacterium]